MSDSAVRRRAHVDERLVVELWERQSYDTELLDARGLAVIFRGVPSDAGGPDYQDAVLAWNDTRLEHGDIEFHVRSSDWYRHAHHRDSRYNRVVLHVVWEDDCHETRRQDSASVPVLALRNSVTVSSLSVCNEPLLEHPCVATFRRLEESNLRDIVFQLGIARFRERADHFGADILQVGADAVAYSALLESLGYASNRESFRYLADAVPYSWLQSLPSDIHAAVLLDAAGLGPPAPIAPPARLAQNSWRLARIRPTNHPARRIAGLVILMQRIGPNLADGLCREVGSAQRPSHLRSLLTVRDGGDARIGNGRADEIAVSVVLPLVESIARTGSAEILFKRYPSPSSNRWTRIMMGLLAEAGHTTRVRSAPSHQGLHNLYHSFCRPEKRERCPACLAAKGGREDANPPHK